jgi:hypothetical protein
LILHYSNHTNGKSYLCDTEGCGLTFDSSTELRNHSFQEHNTVQINKCNIIGCNLAFNTSIKLRDHLNEHENK